MRTWRLHEEIWNYRLRLIWVLYTAAFIFAGSITKNMAVSSFVVTIGALVILVMMCHVLFEKDESKARAMYLIALASCLFLADQSRTVFSDRLGCASGYFFATMIGLLLWIPDSSPRRQELKFTYIGILSLMTAGSMSHLIVTILNRDLIGRCGWESHNYLIAPHALGFMSGVSVGICIGAQLFQHEYTHLPSTCNLKQRILVRCGVLYLLTTFICVYFNLYRLGNKSSLFWILIYVMLYTAPFILAAPAMIGVFLRKSSYRLEKIIGSIIVSSIVMALYCSLVTTAFLHFNGFGNLQFPIKFLLEFISSLSLWVTLSLSVIGVRHLVEKLFQSKFGI